MEEKTWEINGNLEGENLFVFNYTIASVYNLFMEVFGKDLMIKFPLFVDNATSGSGYTPITIPVLRKFCDYYGLDFILRGAITYGKLYHEGNIFGSGYIEAYRLESKEAITPRIIIDEKVLQYTQLNNYLIEGRDFKSFDAFRYYLDNNGEVDTVTVNYWLKTIERYINEVHKNDRVKKSKKRKMLSGLRWLLKTLQNAVKQVDLDKYVKDIKGEIDNVLKKVRTN